MTAFDSAPVPVHRLDDGTIHIGATRPSGPLAETVGLHGADLIVDLGARSDVPYLVIDNVPRALWWLQFVYGEDVTDEVRRLVDPERSEPSTPGRPTARPGFLAAPLLRFAVGVWLWHWWPSHDAFPVGAGMTLSPAGEDWLMIELGTLAWFAEDAFGGKGVAKSLLDGRDRSVTTLATGDPSVDRPLAVVRAFIESVPAHQSTYDELARIENSITTSARVVAETDLDHEFTLTVGADDEVLFRDDAITGHSTVEWGRVRARMLGAAEDNISWEVATTSDGVDEVVVLVPKGDRWTPGHLVHAAMYRNDADEPDALVDFVENETTLTAVVEIAHLSERDSVRVLVFDETDLETGRPDPAGTPADRQAVVNAVASLLGRLPGNLAGAAPYTLGPLDPWPVPNTTSGDRCD